MQAKSPRIIADTQKKTGSALMCSTDALPQAATRMQRIEELCPKKRAEQPRGILSVLGDRDPAKHPVSYLKRVKKKISLAPSWLLTEPPHLDFRIVPALQQWELPANAYQLNRFNQNYIFFTVIQQILIRRVWSMQTNSTTHCNGSCRTQ